MNTNMMQHLKVYRSLWPVRGKFLLLTDGAEDLLRSKLPQDQLLCPFSGPELEHYLDEQHPLDDYSAAIVTIS